ncbi:4-alpha-glucanotransferase [Sediminitomix flava]|uniref:4-alpha-glucanotransferase n=1 Tax=Sediminitomix flava TaxID=379075 RepID=A0A315Z5N0_SEDFL|nr:4-alpha-glucanotransferase [Sediminitomix flava]PWJ39157.1 4-alpha-glucanotransferase [Sediminitomix flava]
MKLRFKVNYYTQWGQRLYIVGSVPSLGKSDYTKAIPMNSFPNGNWELDVEFKGRSSKLEYRYFVKDENTGAIIKEEHGDDRILKVDKQFDLIEINDAWRSKDVYTSSSFTKAVFGGKRTSAKAKAIKVSSKQKELVHRFEILVPRIGDNYEVHMVGNIPSLGEWDNSKAIKLVADEDGVRWSTTVNLQVSHEHVRYKFFLVDSKTGEVVNYEAGDNRYLYVTAAGDEHILQIISEGIFRYDANAWKGTGVAVPVFSLRTHEGMGVGEFNDIKLLVDWAKRVGMKMVQILPVNDTIASHSWIDSYPYAAISVYALHPIYINLEKVGSLKTKKKMDELEKKRRELNALPEIDYEAVLNTKMTYLEALWKEKKTAFYKATKVKAFIKEHEHWLKPYAAFSYLREKFGTPDFNTWKGYQKYSAKKIDALFTDKASKDAVHFYIFLQYHLHLQLLEAAEYARENHVVLKGDIPIGIYRNSTDAWFEPELFNMDGQAGAPPDDFAVNGQNWGFPTYNWDEMKKDGYKWWVSRMTHLSQYFDAFRIDHILGFFRIWEIPLHSVQGLLGQFSPAVPLHIDEFRHKGMYFDYDRLCKPYIRGHFLGDLFHESTDMVRETYFDEYKFGEFQFKEEFDTQRKLEAHFNKMKPKSDGEKKHNDWLRDTLYHLHNEVILIEAKGHDDKQHFVPRVSLDRTRSFQELSKNEQNIIRELYLDYFYHRQEGLWREQALEKLPAITNATNMLICGEDLGMVPDCVPGVMDELDILSLEIQRMPKDPKIEFGHPADYPYMSVGSTSTHDMATVRGWWEESGDATQRFYNQWMGHWGEAPFYCEAWAAEEILNMHLYSPSMWAVFPIQDIMAIDAELRRNDAKAEQINVPAIKHHYWRYRFHMYLEDLLKEDAFNNKVETLIKRSGRNTPF